MTTAMLLSSLAANLALAGIAGLGVGCAFLPRGQRRLLRSENQLAATLGVPLLAARPLVPHALSRQLLAHWFHRRSVLPVVSAERGIGATRIAAQLAREFAAMGERTLLIDADFRSPGLHAEFGLANRGGLTDFLEGRPAVLAHCAENLSVLFAGRSGADPLELLSRQRMQALLAEAAQRYRVVLVDTPSSACGPDLQLFAAFGGGALVVTRRSASPKGLERLRKLLDGSKAQIVGTVIAGNLSPA